MKKTLINKLSLGAIVGFMIVTAPPVAPAQNVTNLVPNKIISWHFTTTKWGMNPRAFPNETNDFAGLAPATNWNETIDGGNIDGSRLLAYGNGGNTLHLGTTATNGFNNSPNLIDNSGGFTTMSLNYRGSDTWSVWGWSGGVPLDADGSANRNLVNAYLNSGNGGFADQPLTNTSAAVTNVPYPTYDLIVYFSSDAAGRTFVVDNGSQTNYASALGGDSVWTWQGNGFSALFAPAGTTPGQNPRANFAFFPGMTSPNFITTVHCPAWGGLAGLQIIQASNVYVLHGATTATPAISLGESTTLRVIAGGANPGYQWRHAGTNLPSAHSVTYTIASAAATDGGAYDCIVTNSFSSTTSLVAQVTVNNRKNLEWAGLVAGNWETTTINWNWPANGPAAYTEGDDTLFGPLGSGQPIVTLTNTLHPHSLTVSNASYTITGGTIGGSGPLSLINNASLTLGSGFTTSGGITVNSGSLLQLDPGSGLGSGNVVNNGALIINNTLSSANSITGSGVVTNITPTGTITASGTLTGSRYVQTGASTLWLQSASSFGTWEINAGELRVSGGLGGGTVYINSATLYLFNSAVYTNALSLSGASLTADSADTLHGSITLAADSTITPNGGTVLVNSNIFGPGNLFKAGGATLTVAGANNSWAGVSITSGTLQIGNGGANASTGQGPIQNDATLNFNSTGSLLVTNPISGFGTINQNGSGTVILTGDASAFSGPININSGRLGGTTTLGGSVAVLPGGTLSPGASVGTLTINGNLDIGGNLFVEVNKALGQSNDLVAVTGSLVNTNNGVLTVQNLGPALAVGNKFTLFNQPVTGGATLTVRGSAIWANNLAVDGSIQVTALYPNPNIGAASVSGGNVLFNGTGGYANGPFNVLSSTNLTTGNWTWETSGTFNGSGNFSVSVPATTGVPQKFYRLQLP